MASRHPEGLTAVNDLTSQSWFGWSIALIIVVPVLVIVLSEVHLRLQRSGNALARPVNGLRLFLLPLAGLLVLLTQGSQVADDSNGVRVVATIVGVSAVATALAGLNAVLFGNAVEGTWRERLPSIFVDLTRLVLVVAGAAIVASAVWGFDVGGLFAALGVGSIVIGLALQNAIGSVVSGLLLLFEQPFKIGDTLDVGGVSGRVMEMNWRSTHVDVGAGIQIIPNATIAGASFTNLSRPTLAHDLAVQTLFAGSDPPHRVISTLTEVAANLNQLRPESVATVQVLGGGAYEVILPLRSASDSALARHAFMTSLWYASRRDEISLDGTDFAQRPRQEVVHALHGIASTLELSDEDVEALADRCEIETYGPGEPIEHAGKIPQRVSFIVTGTARVFASSLDAARVEVAVIERGEVIGLSGLTRHVAVAGTHATTVVEVLQMPMALVDDIIGTRPRVARRLAHHVESRTALVAQAFEVFNDHQLVVAPVTTRSALSEPS